MGLMIIPVLKNFRKISLVFTFLFLCVFNNAEAQTYIVWSTSPGGLTGTFPGGTVTVSQSGPGQSIDFYSPALYDANIQVT